MSHRDVIIFIRLFIIGYHIFITWDKHTFKSIIWDGNTVSVHRPSYYSDRFQKFLGSEVFRPAKSNPRNPRIPPAIKEKQRGDSDEDGSGDQDGPKK